MKGAQRTQRHLGNLPRRREGARTNLLRWLAYHARPEQRSRSVNPTDSGITIRGDPPSYATSAIAAAPALLLVVYPESWWSFVLVGAYLYLLRDVVFAPWLSNNNVIVDPAAGTITIENRSRLLQLCQRIGIRRIAARVIRFEDLKSAESTRVMLYGRVPVLLTHRIVLGEKSGSKQVAADISDRHTAHHVARYLDSLIDLAREEVSLRQKASSYTA
jgi:hypothetical protein